MSIETARHNVARLLREPEDTPWKGSDLTEAIWRWWNLYKRSEAQDTFVRAFEQKRLCITQRPEGTVEYDMKANVIPAEKQSYPGVKYAVGTDSLAARMDPANFTGVVHAGMKQKYALGLFDLSASLLNPEYDSIKGQLRWTFDGSKGKWPVIFIALPDQDDVALYNLLKSYTRTNRDPILLGMVRFIRHRMTRPKLADPKDMGAGPYDISPEGRPAKIKYGWKTSARGVVSEVTKERSNTAAFHYQSILDEAKPITGRGDKKVVSSNEITVALRQTASTRFPVVTEFDQGQNAFMLKHPSLLFPTGQIPDAWKNTVEARSV